MVCVHSGVLWGPGPDELMCGQDTSALVSGQGSVDLVSCQSVELQILQPDDRVSGQVFVCLYEGQSFVQLVSGQHPVDVVWAHRFVWCHCLPRAICCVMTASLLVWLNLVELCSQGPLQQVHWNCPVTCVGHPHSVWDCSGWFYLMCRHFSGVVNVLIFPQLSCWWLCQFPFHHICLSQQFPCYLILSDTCVQNTAWMVYVQYFCVSSQHPVPMQPKKHFCWPFYEAPQCSNSTTKRNQGEQNCGNNPCCWVCNFVQKIWWFWLTQTHEPQQWSVISQLFLAFCPLLSVICLHEYHVHLLSRTQMQLLPELLGQVDVIQLSTLSNQTTSFASI